MLETTKPTSSIPVETCFFCNKYCLADLDYCLTARFCLYSSAERTFLKKWLRCGIPKALYSIPSESNFESCKLVSFAFDFSDLVNYIHPPPPMVPFNEFPRILYLVNCFTPYCNKGEIFNHIRLFQLLAKFRYSILIG